MSSNVCAHALLAWRTVAWLLWYVKVATVVLLMTEYNNYNATKTTTTLAMAMATVGGRSKAGREGAISGARSRLLSPCYMSSPINCSTTGYTRKNKKYLLAWQILTEFLESANVRSECQNARRRNCTGGHFAIHEVQSKLCTCLFFLFVFWLFWLCLYLLLTLSRFLCVFFHSSFFIEQT